MGGFFALATRNLRNKCLTMSTLSWLDTDMTTTTTYTLDAEMNGQYVEDHGLTAAEVAAAKANASRLGITNIRITEEVAVSPADLAPFGL